MMRSNLARHVCRARTGIGRDATHEASRALCLRSRSPCMSVRHVSRRVDYRQRYSTTRSVDDGAAKVRPDNAPHTNDINSNDSVEEIPFPAEPILETTVSAEEWEKARAQVNAREAGKDKAPEAKADAFPSSSSASKVKDSMSLDEKSAEQPEQTEEATEPTPPPTPEDEPSLSDSFRKILRHSTGSVSIMTARTASGEPVGATVSSFASVSVYPRPFFSFNLKRPSKTLDAIVEGSGTFNMHMLDCTQDAAEVAEKFVGRSKKCHKDEIWDHLRWTGKEDEAPMLQGPETPWVFVCRFEFARTVADHDIVVAEVVDIVPRSEVSPPGEYHGSFLTFRDGWYREPGPDVGDISSYSKDRVELLKLKGERQRIRDRNGEERRQLEKDKELRSQRYHQVRWESNERKQKLFLLRMAETDYPAWEAKIRADEREKISAEETLVKPEETKQALPDKTPEGARSKSPALIDDDPVQPSRPLKHAKAKSTTERPAGVYKETREPYIAPWRD